ncbi:MAG TPA: hypothetical protein VIX19_09600 [Terriglobales bacterium]
MAKTEDAVCAIVKQQPRWVRGQWRDFIFKSLEAKAQSAVSVLGQNGRVLEYRPEVNPQPLLKQDADGLHVRAMFTQRLQDNRKWPNPVVLKITHMKPAFAPPKVETKNARFEVATKTALLTGALLDPGNASTLKSGLSIAASLIWTPATVPFPGSKGPRPPSALPASSP